MKFTNPAVTFSMQQYRCYGVNKFGPLLALLMKTLHRWRVTAIYFGFAARCWLGVRYCSRLKISNTVFHLRELESETAEFTPRERLAHPNFTREKVQPLIDASDEEALLVRVTGQLLFDSEHFIKNHLVRVNNWEIHPVFKLEFCTNGNSCKANSDAGWKALDDVS